jgi:hypothetical protein
LEIACKLNWNNGLTAEKTPGTKTKLLPHFWAKIAVSPKKTENFDKIQNFLKLILDNTLWEGVEYKNVG